TARTSRMICDWLMVNSGYAEAGDCLLGVSMQPGGSSRVIVERASAASA
ncbi:MAG: hypothetical protein RIS07_732, partial [Actinomycetota bacterium]